MLYYKTPVCLLNHLRPMPTYLIFRQPFTRVSTAWQISLYQRVVNRPSFVASPIFLAKISIVLIGHWCTDFQRWQRHYITKLHNSNPSLRWNLVSSNWAGNDRCVWPLAGVKIIRNFTKFTIRRPTCPLFERN